MLRVKVLLIKMKISTGKFQKLLIAAAIATTLALAAPSDRKKASQIFPRGSGAIFNLGGEELDQTLQNDD